MSKVKLLNTYVDNLTMSEALEQIDQLIQERNNAYVVTPNVDYLVQLEKNENLVKAYKKASLVLTDGQPLIWISKKLGTPIKEKISGSDLFPHLCKLAKEKGYSMFLLNSNEDVVSKATSKLRENYPGINIIGTMSPSFDFENSQEEVNKVIETINKAKPDMLIVCLGCPKQELFMYQYSDKLNVPISFGLGASLDCTAGTLKRAPKWMSNHGLEWLFRIFQDPKRLFKRYFIDFFGLSKILYKYKKINNA